MKKSFYIPAIVLFVVNVVFCDSVQVGTVLFTTKDLVRKCWSECDKSLLKARLIIQDVLPDPDCIDFSNPEAVEILLDYFHACFQIISSSTYGKLQNLMFIALSDALGGYLRAYVLPFTRRAYYAGQVKYSEAEKLFQLYDDIKLFLKTNGVGWAEPQEPNLRKIYITPLAITGGAIEACDQLFTIEKEDKFHCLNSNFYLRNNKLDFVKRVKKSEESFPKKEDSEGLHQNSNPFLNLNSTYAPKFNQNLTKIYESDLLKHRNDPNSEKFLKKFFEIMSMNITQEPQDDPKTLEEKKSRCNCGCAKCSGSSEYCKRVIVPLPILDDCVSPHSIAVPFKKQPFRNLKTRSSAFILEYYYIAVIKCFIAKGNSRADIRNFNSKFYSWLFSQVYPHLNEEQWYPAFGGVLRIMETIKRFGKDSFVGDLTAHNIGHLFDSGVEFEVEGDKRGEKVRNVNNFEECSYSKRHVLTAVIMVSLIWVFVFCACMFYFQAARGHNIFYEGYSEASSRSRYKDTKKKDKFINFQFLIRFFRKREENCAKDNQTVLWNVEQAKTKCLKADKKPEPKRRLKDQLSRKSKQPDKQRLLPYGKGDFPALNIPTIDKHFKGQLSAWPCQPCLVPPEKLKLLKPELLSAGDFSMPHDQGHRIELLWKKPSMKIKRNFALPKEGHVRKSPRQISKLTVRETTMTTTTTSEEIFGKNSSNTYSASLDDEMKTTEKATSSCCCRESCNHSRMTTTTTSSYTQVEEKLSSATMEFFEKVISKHKSFRKGLKRESTKELDSEEECLSS